MDPLRESNAGETVLYHFNDVYHVNQPTVLSRFAHKLKEKGNAITVFSGDAFGPSPESSILKGEHIVPILNYLDIDIACYGNHDFDFGEDRLTELSATCNFPFLLSNAFHPSGKLLTAAKEYVIHDYLGFRIGFFGLAGTDWPSNCQHLPHGNIISNPVQTASKISVFLKQNERVDLVVAVTHMRLEEDLLVSEHCPHVDLILGGHDHDIVVHGDQLTHCNDDATGRIRICVLSVPIDEDGKPDLGSIHAHHERDLSLHAHPEDPEIPRLLASLQNRIAAISSKPLFYTAVSLDGRGTIIRTTETNLGNFLADVVRAYYNTDIAFVNSGFIRCDRVVPPGVLTVRDVVDILPFGNPFIVKQITTRTLLQALENSVSDSRTDGRFLQLSGIAIEVDFARPQGSRVRRVTAPLPTTFTVAMSTFIADCFDGYTCFDSSDTEVETLVGAEGAMTDTGILLEILELLDSGEFPPAELSEEEADFDRIARARKKVFVLDGAHGERERDLPMVRPRIEGRIFDCKRVKTYRMDGIDIPQWYGYTVELSNHLLLSSYLEPRSFCFWRARSDVLSTRSRNLHVA
ncbi:Metallo-dependent phosphatase-like protein [Rhodocollybia butyracea]|uniref:Metallo-dependent phosphatase-like protein n=1 Tax=Rhodocollybia butyracea TaxID=206335 RepID=A0A9P5UGE8_9AGAR|nr:Metallo-dependent phosphatase-like protein [Rhodocollybia butyracea]